MLGHGAAAEQVQAQRRGSRRWCIHALAAAVALLALFATPAFAERLHTFEKSFGEPGSAAGQVLLRGSSGGVAGSGVAINDTTHDVYVADTENHRVDEFADDGTFVRAWGWGVGGGIGFETCASTCQAGLSGTGAGEFEAPVFVAVDNSNEASDPSKGDVYVGDTSDNVVSKFTADGALVESWGTKGQLTGSTTGAGAFGSLAGVVVGATGMLDVLNTGSEMFEFDPDGTFTGTEFEVARATLPTGLGVSASGDFFKVNGNQTVEELHRLRW